MLVIRSALEKKSVELAEQLEAKLKQQEAEKSNKHGITAMKPLEKSAGRCRKSRRSRT
jgi:hypothetical protein